MIEQYSFGSITIDGKTYHHDVVVAGTKVKKWWRNSSHEVTINDLEIILEENPQTIIFGTGEAGVCQIMPETIEFLDKQKIKFTILPTDQAVKEYNARQKNDSIVGAFHLTC